jgi:hypothetical protein
MCRQFQCGEIAANEVLLRPRRPCRCFQPLCSRSTLTSVMFRALASCRCRSGVRGLAIWSVGDGTGKGCGHRGPELLKLVRRGVAERVPVARHGRGKPLVEGALRAVPGHFCRTGSVSGGCTESAQRGMPTTIVPLAAYTGRRRVAILGNQFAERRLREPWSSGRGRTG